MEDKKPSFTAYVHFGSAPGPFLTVKAHARYRETKQSNTARGPLQTHWELRVADKWRRLYFSSGTPSHFVRVDRQRVKVQLVEVQA